MNILARILIGLLWIALVLRCAVAAPADIEQRVEALLQQMTIDEKVGQLNQLCTDQTPNCEQQVAEGRVGSVLGVLDTRAHKSKQTADRNFTIKADARLANRLQKAAVERSRLHIPLIIAHDIIHGMRTVFPVPLAESCSFDPSLAEKTVAIAAREARASGIQWTFAPMVDIARDPRWGRIVEGSGEDPYLGSQLAAARVRGFQSAVMATAKHYVAYGAAEGGRDYNSVDISERVLREVYLPPFDAAVKAGVDSIMVAFDDLGGVPATGNDFTVKQILRGEWGYNGIVISDWASVHELCVHGVAKDDAAASVQSLGAGVDVDMVAEAYVKNLPKLVAGGAVPLGQVDDAVRRVLRAKFQLGLFDHPYADVDRIDGALLRPDAVALARRAARESIVLLKNERGALPLRRSVKTVALIGPLADDALDMMGSWNTVGNPADAVTLRQALTQALPRGRVLYARGCDAAGTSRAGFPAALAAARSADVVVLAMGEHASMSGEAACRSSLDLPGPQAALASEILATGKPVVLVLMNGRPLTLGALGDRVPAIVEAWYLGIQAGPAVVDVLFGDYNPAGRLPVSFPRTVGQVPIYYNHRNTGRPHISKYLDIPNTPQYPFGFGLSYTRFDYGNLHVTPSRVTVDVANRGARAGDEVVQLYLHQRVGSTSRPVLQLAGFYRISLKPGEKRTVSFTVGREQLRMIDRTGKWAVEPGTYDVLVGPSSATGLRGRFELTPAAADGLNRT